MQKIRSGAVGMTLSVPEEPPIEEEEDNEVQIDSIRSTLSDEPIIMNAIKDTETGEMLPRSRLASGMWPRGRDMSP